MTTQACNSAEEYCRQALDLISRYNLQPTPINYDVFYAVASRSHTDLCRTFDVIISNRQEVTQTAIHELYDRFLTSALFEKTLIDLSRKMESELSSILNHMGETGEKTNDFGANLSRARKMLQGQSKGRSPQDIIKSLMVSTRAMEERVRLLDGRLKASTQIINELKDDLETARTETQTDELTGLANRRAFNGALRHAAMMAMEHNGTLCLAICDIDHFKAVNDTWGHQTGDHVLRLIATCLNNGLQDPALAARYGGEEFAIVMPGRPLSEAAALCDALRSTVATRRMVRRTTGESIGPITISFGIAQYDIGEPLNTLIERADTCLYAAKRCGRNMVVTQDDIANQKRAAGAGASAAS